MRARTAAFLLLAATAFPVSAHADHTVSSPCAGSVEYLEAQLRGAIRASVNAGCDPFGGLMARSGCGERIAEIRDIAHAIEFAELTAVAADPDNCAGPMYSLTATDQDLPRGPRQAGDNGGESSSTEAGAARIAHEHPATKQTTGAAAQAAAQPIPTERLSVRSVGPVFLPKEDDRFEAIAKGAENLPNGAANAAVSWTDIGNAPAKGDRLGTDNSVTTASVE